MMNFEVQRLASCLCANQLTHSLFAWLCVLACLCLFSGPYSIKLIQRENVVFPRTMARPMEEVLF